MKEKLKFPAYAKQIVKQRHRGVDPWFVSIFFTRFWMRPVEGGRPLVMILPGEYDEGEYNFKFLASTSVTVFVDLDSDSKYLRLAAEVATYAAPVYVSFVSFGEVVDKQELSDIAVNARFVSAGRYVWPSWWNEDFEVNYFSRCARFAELYTRDNPDHKLQDHAASDQ